MPLPPHIIAQSASERIAPLKGIKDENSLLVHEIYASIQGESTYAGVPCVFIRLTGCHLRCTYCDTEHAFEQGSLRTLNQIIDEVTAMQIPLVELTGGEPLLQKNALKLMRQLCDLGHKVLLETSGATSIEKVDPRVKVIMDVKTPGSGESARNLEKNVPLLWSGCELKFVICDRRDYEWAKEWISQHDIPSHIPLLFSPEAEKQSPQELVEWIMADKLPVRFQLQMHKVLWGQEQGR